MFSIFSHFQQKSYPGSFGAFSHSNPQPPPVCVILNILLTAGNFLLKLSLTFQLTRCLMQIAAGKSRQRLVLSLLRLVAIQLRPSTGPIWSIYQTLLLHNIASQHCIITLHINHLQAMVFCPSYCNCLLAHSWLEHYRHAR